MDDKQRTDAVDAAYRQHADDVYRVAFAIVRDADSAMDATQDAFARAYEQWDRYDAARPMLPWLHSIVGHIALDRLRRQKTHLRTIGALQSRSPGALDDPSTSAARRDLVEASLAALSAQARAALVLQHYYGYTYKEIARFIGTSPGNVGSILARSHAALRARLADLDTTEPTADASSGPSRSAASPIPDRGLR